MTLRRALEYLMEAVEVEGHSAKWDGNCTADERANCKICRALYHAQTALQKPDPATDKMNIDNDIAF